MQAELSALGLVGQHSDWIADWEKPANRQLKKSPNPLPLQTALASMVAGQSFTTLVHVVAADAAPMLAVTVKTASANTRALLRKSEKE